MTFRVSRNGHQCGTHPNRRESVICIVCQTLSVSSHGADEICVKILVAKPERKRLFRKFGVDGRTVLKLV